MITKKKIVVVVFWEGSNTSLIFRKTKIPSESFLNFVGMCVQMGIF